MADESMRRTGDIGTEEKLKEALPDKFYCLIRFFSSKASLSSWNYLMPILSLMSVLLGAQAEVLLQGHDWREHILIWSLCVAFSSIGKTPAFKKVRGCLKMAEEMINYALKAKLLQRLDPSQSMSAEEMKERFADDLKDFQPVSILAESVSLLFSTGRQFLEYLPPFSDDSLKYCLIHALRKNRDKS